MVRESISKKGYRTVRCSVKNTKGSEKAGVDMIADLINQFIVEGVIPAEWELSTIANH